MNLRQNTTLLLLIIVTTLIYTVNSCSIFQGLDNIRVEAEELIGQYPKTNYTNIYFDFSHTSESHGSQYEILKNKLSEYNFTFQEAIEPNPDIAEDTRLLATLRQDVGMVMIPEPNRNFSERELRALELFVLFGGRLIITSPPSAQTSSAYGGILDRFGMDVSNTTIDKESGMYYPETMTVSDTFEARGHIVTPEEGLLSTNFHEYDKVVMLFPVALNAVENNSFQVEEVLSKITSRNGRVVTGLKATPKLSFQTEKGFVYALGSGFFAKAPIDGGSREPDRSGYQGGMLTSGNYKFMANLFSNGDRDIVIDDTPPVLDITFPQTVEEGSSIVRATGNITDIGGVAKITFLLNGFSFNVPFDAFENPAQRYDVNNRIPAAFYLTIPEEILIPGTNQIEITATDQFLNSTSQSFSFAQTVQGAGRFMTLTSKLPNSETIDPQMGVDLKGGTFSYPNEATFGGPLTEFSWGGRDNGCLNNVVSLVAFTTTASAPNGAGRADEMNMPNTESAIASFNGFNHLLTVHFGELNLDEERFQIVNHGERRIYNNPGTPAFLEFRYNGTPIARSVIRSLTFHLSHNAPRNCNDDTIYGTSNIIPTQSFSIPQGLANREQAIADGLLADLRGNRGIRFRGHIFNRIIHSSGSEAIIPGGGIRFPIGVHHPDPATPGLEGVAYMEIIR